MGRPLVAPSTHPGEVLKLTEHRPGLGEIRPGRGHAKGVGPGRGRRIWVIDLNQGDFFVLFYKHVLILSFVRHGSPVISRA